MVDIRAMAEKLISDLNSDILKGAEQITLLKGAQQGIELYFNTLIAEYLKENEQHGAAEGDKPEGSQEG